MTKKYEKSHPWINFNVNMGKAGHRFWMLLGEAQSKCEHIEGALLSPDDARELHRIYLAKGAHATTAIEGNTLSDAEVKKILEKKLTLPESKQYLQREVQNIIGACNEIARRHIMEDNHPLSVDEIKRFNLLVLDGLPPKEDVVPGEIRKHRVGVGRYLGAPAEDCEHLLGRLCEMLGDKAFTLGTGMEKASGILKAIIAHLYIAWIHPFGDGNGRTARLVEFKMCVSAGIPVPASHLLTNHYNETRTEYYNALDRTSRERSIFAFAEYAILGYVDQLSEQIDRIRKAQYKAFWTNYVHSKFSGTDTASGRRKRNLIIDMSDRFGFDFEGERKTMPIAKIHEVSSRVMEAYSKTTTRTRARDIGDLIGMGLLIREGSSVRPNFGIVIAFLPATAKPL